MADPILITESSKNQIPLSHGLVARVDPEWFSPLSQYRWFAKGAGSSYSYAARTVKVGGKDHTIYMHRLITGAPAGICVDHANGDTLDNRTPNLRLCTKQQNVQNMKRPRTNTTGYKGVTFYESTGKWVARIRQPDGHLYLGSFSSPERAALAYNEAATRFHGEFARLNLLPAIPALPAV